MEVVTVFGSRERFERSLSGFTDNYYKLLVDAGAIPVPGLGTGDFSAMPLNPQAGNQMVENSETAVTALSAASGLGIGWVAGKGVIAWFRGIFAARGIGRSLDNLSSLRGASVRDVEALADAKYLQQGWTKKPLSDGNGIRYFDGEGNSFQINQGYPGGGGMHGGAYVKTTQGNQIVRIPLEGNPGL